MISFGDPCAMSNFATRCRWAVHPNTFGAGSDESGGPVAAGAPGEAGAVQRVGVPPG